MNVLDENGKFLFSDTIDAAKRYAKKHNMLLINYEDGKQATSKAIQMQVLSQKKVVEDTAAPAAPVVGQPKPEKKKSDVKKFNLSESTSDHDLETKLRKIAYFLNKNKRVRLVISGFKMDQKFKILDKIKKRFSPHLAFKQISNNTSAVKLYIVPEKSFGEFYRTEYLKDGQEIQNVEDEAEADEEDLISNEDLEGLINEKLK